VVIIPWGVKPSVVYYIHTTAPTPTPHKAPHKPPTKTPTKPHVAPTKPAPTPTPAKKPPPPAPVSPPPSPAIHLPPPAPVVTGRRLLTTKKLLYPYRYLTEYSKSAKTYKFKTLTVSRGTKLQFRINKYGGTGGPHHGLARTGTKYRCGHPIETYVHPTSKVTTFTVTLPHKGTFHFYDPTLTLEPVLNLKGHVAGHSKQYHDCEHYFISLSVKVT
jgi:hypothetical protein